MDFNHCIDSSSSDDETQYLIDQIEIDTEVIANQICRNNEACLFYKNVDTTHGGGSLAGRRTIFCGQEAAAAMLFNDYFSKNSRYNDEHFCRRFRMSCTLFVRIVEAVKKHDRYFVQCRNTAGTLGLSTLQKVTTAFRILAYGYPADAIDENIRIGESTTLESVKRFYRAVVEIFGERYLRTPTPDDVA